MKPIKLTGVMFLCETRGHDVTTDECIRCELSGGCESETSARTLMLSAQDIFAGHTHARARRGSGVRMSCIF
jgi:hypothetical protein